ncbi:MAG: type I-E CRISPR-associated protein Cas6/Cse3/CasE [Rhodocyclales bacterium]|nr:type I-E CRISPR-associated protein Cas6/Cse3/CasE [Rhodocyclales bacterium]
MYFSLITPHPSFERRAAHEWLGGAYCEHQWLWRFFPSPVGTERDFLFRRRDADGLPRFYVVSQRTPRPDSDAWQVQCREYRPQVPSGARLSFELRANPVVSRADEKGAKRHDVVMDTKKRLLAARGLPNWGAWTSDRITADGQPDPPPPLYELVLAACTDWLTSRSEQHGFALDESTVSVAAYEQHGGKRGQLRFSTVDLAGELVVTDTARFATTLANGIGRAKAFGCGLLLVRPAT